MAEVVMGSIPGHGHVMPLLGVADGLIAAGHRVRWLTGARFADVVASTGAEHVPLPPAADFDDRTFDPLADADPRPRGLAAMRIGVGRVFFDPVPEQHRALLALVDDPVRPADVVVVEPGFVSAALLAGRPRAQRPPVVAIGVFPLPLVSPEVPPQGLGLAPLRGPLNVVRNVALQTFVERVALRPLQQRFDALYRETLGRPAPTFVFNAASVVDAIVQLSAPSFEFHRRPTPVPLHFAGPVPRAAPNAFDEPPWWAELTQDRPVVHVTQGTLENTDLGQLVRLTLEALAAEDVLVVATTGGPALENLGTLPPNARGAVYVPHDRLLPHVDVMVTNGGYGGVQQALAHGIPLVVAGDTQDKPDVAARVAYAGAGISLRTATPTPRRVRAAVRRVLDEPSYAAAAGRLAAEASEAGGMRTVLEVVDGLLDEWRDAP